MDDKFTPGDIVRLKSDWYGNHVMTVGEVHETSSSCGCVWFDDKGDLCKDSFGEETLELATKPNL